MLCGTIQWNVEAAHHAAWFVGKFAAVFLAERSTQLAVGHRNLGAASGADPSEGIGSAVQHPYAKRVFVRLQPPNLRRVGRRRCYGMPSPQPVKKSPQSVTLAWDETLLPCQQLPQHVRQDSP